MSETKSPLQGEGEDKEFTQKAVKKYLEDSLCPFCGSDNVEPVYGKQDFDDGEFLNKKHCDDCSNRWWEVYKLHGIYPEETS